MELDDRFHDGEAETRAARPFMAGLPESIEDVRKVLGPDSRAGILHTNMYLLAISPAVQDNMPTSRCEAERIFDEISEHAQHRWTIDPEEQVGGARADYQRHARVPGRRLVRLPGFLEQWAKRVQPLLQHNLPGL